MREGWPDERIPRDAPQLPGELDRLHKATVVYRKLLEELRARLDPVTVPGPAAAAAELRSNGHSEGPLCPIACAVREAARVVEEGNDSLRSLLSSLGI
jgi:hypothetical protein